MDGKLTGINTPVESGPGSNGNKVIHRATKLDPHSQIQFNVIPWRLPNWSLVT